MKKLIIGLFACSILFSSCETKETLNDDISKLKVEKATLESDVTNLKAEVAGCQSSKDHLTENISAMQKQMSEMTAVSTGNAKYILKLHLRQVSYSLSIRKQLRDAANAIDFEIPVDKDFYNAVTVGSDLVDDFRVGSLIFKGSFGSWKIKVTDKRIVPAN